MKQALEALKLSNISVGEQSGTEYGSTTRVSADVCKHLHLQYYQVVFMWNTLCILTGVQYLLIEHDKFCSTDYYYAVECV